MEKSKTKHIGFFSSLYIRIAAIILLVLILVSVAYLYIAVFTAEMYFQEANQRLNVEVAQHIADEHEFFIDGEVQKKSLEKVFHDIMVINPSIEVYLLNTEGNILAYYAPNKKVLAEKVHLEPIKKFVETKGSSFLMGVDPKDGSSEKTFSAAEVYEDGIHRGYIYVILGSEEYITATQFVLGSYILRLGVRSMTITLIAAALLSLFALALITKNFRNIISVIRRFKDGDLSARINVKGKSELREFANSFNEMADTIVKNLEEIKTMDNLRRELVANVSHDLRTPLASIQGYIETIMIKKDSLSEEEQQKYLRVIFNSTERLKILVAELFELSKLEARETKPQPEAFSLAELVQDIYQKNKMLAGKRNIKIKVESPSTLPLVYADIRMMEKVIQNLLDNSLKFTPENGNITIRLLNKNNFIRFELGDDGQGINEKELPFIFERYQRKKRYGQKENEGSGLGLAIVKRILEVHQIEINVKSIEGKETIFSFEIPVYILPSIFKPMPAETA
ncbi:MAG: HAMP domain-containing protein [Ignavibacteriales bacterium]|nr:MAG: HAMP domain-containing protein [Ignavibacteriales bacterium]